jgi:hypothetical protein
MGRARAYTIDSHKVAFPGPQVHERRPKARRHCLGCDRMMLTTCAERLCRLCLRRAADLRGGLDEMYLLGALTQTERGTLSS